jgi:hypothetical protein
VADANRHLEAFINEINNAVVEREIDVHIGAQP